MNVRIEEQTYKGVNMKRKRLIVAAAVLLMVLLTGCSTVGLDAQTLMKPPKTTGDKQEIYQVLERKTNSHLKLCYPKAGDYRSAIVMRDVTGDGNEEAIAFYSNGDEDFTNVSVISEIDGVWTEINSFQNPATQIDRICFGDLSGNGVMEFAVGWGNSATGISKLNLYFYLDGQFQEIQTKESYNELTVLELDSSGRSGIVAVSLATSEQLAAAKLYGIVNNQIELLGTADLDPDVTRYYQMKVSKINGSHSAVILDGAKSANAYHTEILYWDDTVSQLRNPLYRADSKTTAYTSRSVPIESQDINGDNVIEVPITNMMPGGSMETGSDTSFITNWHCYDISTDTFTNLLSTVVNSKDGYMFMMPDLWKDKVTTEWDESDRRLTFYEWLVPAAEGEMGKKGEPLLTIQVMTEEEWQQNTGQGERYKLKQHENMIFTAQLPTSASALSLTMEQVEENFRLFIQG